ncbi:PfkB family carbohydrate kinase [Demequina litorisediminis]|uniref:Ribokinase n=1 Tax=Demequina litorisediminis TaxID=1849022 RepID=A0ABQ6IE01_9MICO|nr:ribokinase [Demequina litorisediminis]
MLAHLSGSGVRLAAGSDAAPATSVATATLDATGAATYEFDLTWDIAESATPRPTPVVVHTGSIAAVLDPGADAVLALVHSARDHATVTYDPNARPTLMGDPATALARIDNVVAASDVVKVSDEDLAWLAQATDGDGEDLAKRWTTAGPALVVVTRGGEGATAMLHDGREVGIVAPKVSVVDTVGAGDSFMAGLIDGLWSARLLGASQRDALRAIDDATLSGILTRCARIGAITVSRAGANPPTAAEPRHPP